MSVERHEFFGKRRIKRPQLAIDLGVFVEDHAASPVLVMEPKNFFNHVGEGPVTKILKKRSGSADNARLIADLVMRAQKIQRACHEMHHADRMSKPAMLGALISEHRKPELFDATKPLELDRVDQLDDQQVVRPRFIKRDDVVERVSIISLRQTKPRAAPSLSFEYYHGSRHLPV